MDKRINPFHNLYLGEATGPDRFVQLFSPMFVEHVTALFQPGHVVLQGLQGSGKSMLLNLLKPEIRIAYFRASQPFPVRQELAKFIGAGINLRRAGLIEFGQLVLPETSRRELAQLALQYGDFLNYWIVSDLLEAIRKFRDDDQALQEQIGLHPKAEKLDELARRVSQASCFFGFMKGCDTFSQLGERVAERITTYRKYLNFNLGESGLPASIRETITVAGEPVSVFSGLLKETGILEQDAEVYVRIDQYEQLRTLNTSSGAFGDLCRDVTHKVLASRDLRVSYRLGTRHYAWPDVPAIYGTKDVLEHKRDYSLVDIDEKLRRKENRRTWIFPAFAEDIFSRRLGEDAVAERGRATRTRNRGGDSLETVFGKSLSPDELARLYAPNDDAREKSMQLDEGAPAAWRQFMSTLCTRDPLMARFADAWVHQRDQAKKSLTNNPPDIEGPYPWGRKKYWMKERHDQALMQIASCNRQQLIWAGKEDVLHLGGGNILVFLFLCQHVWDAWLRDTRDIEDIGVGQASITLIDVPVQAQGIREASEEWSRKVREGEDSERRGRFLRVLGQHFYRQLTDDRAMSHPGANGFSVSIDDLDQHEDIRNFLRTCVEYGDLYDAPHTSKAKGERRRKYYLAPVLSPYFKIPYAHTKEPLYVNVAQIRAWIDGTVLPKPNSVLGARQMNIFPET